MRLLLIAAVSLAAGCAGQKMGGLSQPGTFTSPPKYLETVGLETHTKDDVLRVLGPPDSQTEHDDRDMWTYLLSGDGARHRYTYIFKGDSLYNVQYNESGLSGPYSGYTAREAQSDN